ncbi:MAG: DUF4910 domain-containing protein [Desulfurococcales archaeon]|nr:DUF4910 domain-containing protein [Desulfurococcales archaeon]
MLDGIRIHNLVKSISNYHRIPGSQGYLEASDFVRDYILQLNLDVEMIYLKDTSYFKKPPSWTVKSAWMKWNASKWSYNDIPTLVAAYSESTGGEILEGPIVFEEKKRCGGENAILVTHKHPLILYKRCGDQLNNLSGIIYYVNDKARTGSGFPYIRIPPILVNQLSVPVITSSRILTERLIKKEPGIELFIDLKNDEYKIPVIKTLIPGKTESSILLIAHLCHPKPGANDNASGAATLLWLAQKFSEKMKETWQPFHNIVLVWTPEYLGTIYALETGFIPSEKFVFALNLDMVGGDPRLNGGSLNLVESSPSSPGIEEAVVSYFLEKEANSNKSWGGSTDLPYVPFKPRVLFEFGSDHDVLASYGIPAIMINQWPDKYYHTNEDAPEKISPQILQIVGQASLRSLHYISRLTSEKGDSLSRMVWKYLLHSLDNVLGWENNSIRNGIESIKQRFDLIKMKTLGDPYLRKLVEEQFDRISTLLTSLINIFTYYEETTCFEGEHYNAVLKYIPENFVLNLNYESAEKYYDPLTRTLLIEFYRLLGNGWDTNSIERYLKGYYGISDKEVLCTIKHFIEELHKKNLLKNLGGG